MEFIRAADTSELPVGTMKKVVLGGAAILLANVDGVYYAINNKCPHLGGSLADGTLAGPIVTCPRHGARYDVRTGQAVHEAQILFVKTMPKEAQPYPVKVEGTSVLVGLP